MTLTAQQLKDILPGVSDKTSLIYLPILNVLLPVYKIDTPARIGAFIAQVGYECINFTTMAEIGTGQEYEGRADLGNTHPGDGPRYKGRGAIQVTGRDNYAWCSKDLFGDDRLLKAPETLLQPEYAIRSACWFWTVAKSTLNSVCDQPETYTHNWGKTKETEKVYTKIQWITLLINGGQNGLTTRTKFYNEAKIVLGF